MIATHVRKKLAAHLSYSLTLAELRGLLHPASERFDTDVWFWSPKPPRRNEQRESYQVLEARYAPDSPRELFVSPVPRTMRAVIRASLIPAATDRVREWLLAHRSEMWHSSPHRIAVRFITASAELEFTEHPKT